MLFAEIAKPVRDDEYLEYTEPGYAHERSTHNMNYFLIVLFHADVDKRPCRPVVRVVHLTRPPPLVRADTTDYSAIEMLVTCQLCDTSVNSPGDLCVEPLKLLCSYALSITDTEANQMINNVADINTQTAARSLRLSHRSNISLLPRFMHRGVQTGIRSIFHVRLASSATDVQLAVILLRESLNEARSITVKLRSLHPYLATPEHLFESVASFMRPLDLFTFKAGNFKFLSS